MTSSNSHRAIILASAIGLGASAGIARAQPTGGQFSIPWATLDAGGNTAPLIGGRFRVVGTIGQPDASPAPLVGGNFLCRTGFWAGAAFCPADMDGNGRIEPADINVLVNIWFASLQQGTLAGDFDGNGHVEPADVSVFVAAWFAALTNGC